MANVYVNIDLSEFDDDDLIDELEGRDYKVLDPDEVVDNQLTEEEIDDILSRYSWAVPGSLGYNIYEKLRKGLK